MSNILLIIAICLIIFLILILYRGLCDISGTISDLYILYYEKLSYKNDYFEDDDYDDFELNFKER